MLRHAANDAHRRWLIDLTANVLFSLAMAAQLVLVWAHSLDSQEARLAIAITATVSMVTILVLEGQERPERRRSQRV